MNFSDQEIAAIKPDASTLKKFPTKYRGLYLCVYSGGTKSWRVEFRNKYWNKTISFGSWPGMNFEEAKVLVDYYKGMLKLGWKIDEIKELLDKCTAGMIPRIRKANGKVAVIMATAEEWPEIERGTEAVDTDSLAPEELSNLSLSAATAKEILQMKQRLQALKQ